MKRLAFLIPIFLTFCFFTGVARAVEVDDDGVIAVDEVVHDDVYLAANYVHIAGVVEGVAVVNASDVLIDGVVEGDVFIWASTATISGEIHGNLLFAGQKLTLSGQVGDSLFFGGGAIELDAQTRLGRNLYFIGYSLAAQPGSQIARDVSALGYQALFNGRVGRDIKGEFSALELGGAVGGDMNVTVEIPGQGAPPYVIFSPGLPGPLDTGLRVAPSALVSGTLTYASPVDQFNNIQGLNPRKVVFERRLSGAEQLLQRSFLERLGDWALEFASSALSLLAVGALAFWLVPKSFSRAVEKLHQPQATVSWGLVTLLGGYGGAFVFAFALLTASTLLLMFTLGGLAATTFFVGISALVFALASFTALVTFVSKLVVAGLLGKLILSRGQFRQQPLSFGAMAVGVAAYLLLRTLPDLFAIPLLGLFIGVGATLAGLGAIWLSVRSRAA